MKIGPRPYIFREKEKIKNKQQNKNYLYKSTQQANKNYTQGHAIISSEVTQAIIEMALLQQERL